MSKRTKSISIIIPVYNEERILSKVIYKVVNNLDKMGLSYEILLIENGSTDSSQKICKEIEKELKNIHTFHLDDRNYGAALKYGFLAAKKNLSINFSVDWVDFDFLKNSLNKSQKYDIILASKNLRPNLDQRSFIRVIGGTLFHRFSNLVIKSPFTDTHGLRLINNRRAERVLKKCLMGGEMFEAEMLIRSFHEGLKVLEVPIMVKEYRPSRVSIVKRSVRGIIQLVQLRNILKNENINVTQTKNIIQRD